MDNKCIICKCELGEGALIICGDCYETHISPMTNRISSKREVALATD